MSTTTHKRTAADDDVPFEEDVLTEMAQKVIEVIDMYAESYENVTVTDPDAMKSRAVDFVMNVVKYTSDQEKLLSKVEWAVKKYLRDTQNRQWAVQLMNEAHNYAWAFYLNSDDPNIDDLIDAKTNEVIVNQGVDLNELNEIVESIY